MQEPNLLTIDDVLIRGAKIASFFVLSGIVLAVLVPSELRGPDWLWAIGLGFAAMAPVGMAFCGFAFRDRERRAVALMRLLDRQVELVAGDLLANSELTRDTLETAIRDLNSTGVRHLVWDRKTGLIQDGRLRQSRLHIETCRACGVKISLDIALNEAAEARCPSCDSLIDAREVDEEKQAVIEELGHRADRPLECPRPAKPAFSLPLFLLLLVVAWPLALFYAVRHWTFAIEPGSI
ncbi:MAG: hypothetical protein IPK00_16340 [Deltaproteobacteria bacterium]|nr:hypothetical protein [Deltaproteobacteria bacterium]